MMVKKRLFIDLDGVVANADKKHEEYKLSCPEQPYPQSQFGFFFDLELIENSKHVIMQLLLKYDIWFLTAPSYKNPYSYTEKAAWVKKHFGEVMLEKLIFCSDKSICQGEYLIDDNYYGRGQNKFKGELILFGSKRFPNWESIYNYLK
jgi:5'(3')-deoxyribonucleotidase